MAEYKLGEKFPGGAFEWTQCTPDLSLGCGVPA